ncbi:4Fe-4S dicluster domain-containing protein, partial [bacterium]|nr:4Fe-4S dicluster domain-containing protein [bacterium]
MATADLFLDEAKALTCIHCGLCLAHCPTYLETGNENDSPRGRIYLMRAVQSGRLSLAHAAVKHIDLCLGCRACEAVCPSGVKYGELLETTREHIENRYRRSLFQRFLRRAIGRVFPFPGRTRWALALGRAVPKFLVPPSLRGALGLLPDRSETVQLREFSPATAEPKRGRVGLVTGCVQSVMFGDTNAATVRLLNRAGYDVVIPRAQVCCGALDAHSGNLDRAREFARTNLAAFGTKQLDAIVINAAGCGSTLKEYGHLLPGDPRATAFSAKVKDLSEFLVDKIQDSGSKIHGRITYHDACHLAHAQRITKQPRDLVRAVAGDEFVELPESDVCCGSAGIYNLVEPEVAAE